MLIIKDELDAIKRLEKQPKEIWEENYKQKFGCENYPHPEIRQFIQELLDQQMKDIIENIIPPETDSDEMRGEADEGWNACRDKMIANINYLNK